MSTDTILTNLPAYSHQELLEMGFNPDADPRLLWFVVNPQADRNDPTTLDQRLYPRFQFVRTFQLAIRPDYKQPWRTQVHFSQPPALRSVVAQINTMLGLPRHENPDSILEWWITPHPDTVRGEHTGVASPASCLGTWPDEWLVDLAKRLIHDDCV